MEFLECGHATNDKREHCCWLCMCSSENPRITLTCSHPVSIADHRALTRQQKRKRTVSQDDAHDPDKMLASMKAQHTAEVKKAVAVSYTHLTLPTSVTV